MRLSQPLGLVLVFGCTAPPRDKADPDSAGERSDSAVVRTYDAAGRVSYVIDCSDSSNTWDMSPDLRTWGDCYKLAGEKCRERGYTVSERSEVPHTYQESWFGLLRTATKRSLTISCGPEQGSETD